MAKKLFWYYVVLVFVSLYFWNKYEKTRQWSLGLKCMSLFCSKIFFFQTVNCLVSICILHLQNILMLPPQIWMSMTAFCFAFVFKSKNVSKWNMNEVGSDDDMMGSLLPATQSCEQILPVWSTNCWIIIYFKYYLIQILSNLIVIWELSNYQSYQLHSLCHRHPYFRF